MFQVNFKQIFYEKYRFCYPNASEPELSFENSLYTLSFIDYQITSAKKFPNKFIAEDYLYRKAVDFLNSLYESVIERRKLFKDQKLDEFNKANSAMIGNKKNAQDIFIKSKLLENITVDTKKNEDIKEMTILKPPEHDLLLEIKKTKEVNPDLYRDEFSPKKRLVNPAPNGEIFEIRENQVLQPIKGETGYVKPSKGIFKETFYTEEQGQSFGNGVEDFLSVIDGIIDTIAVKDAPPTLYVEESTKIKQEVPTREQFNPSVPYMDTSTDKGGVEAVYKIVQEGQKNKLTPVDILRNICKSCNVTPPEYDFVRENDVYRCTALFCELNFVSSYAYDRMDAKSDSCKKVIKFLLENWEKVLQNECGQISA